MLAPIPNNKPVIYFAGKIGKNDWRSQIFGDRCGAVPDGDNYGFDRLFDESLTIEHGWFTYGGPFFISCDHGCGHGNSGHGASPQGCLGGLGGGRLEVRDQIWNINCTRIQRADYVFAYLNETDAYGTLIELGYAAALDKQIGVGIGRNIKVEEYKDLWMARQCGSVWLGSPSETFAEFRAYTASFIKVPAAP